MAEEKDVQDNKIYAILAYFGPLFLVPLLAAKNSPFAKFHTNQGIILFILWLAVWILSLIVIAISWRLYIIIQILYLGITVLAIIGIINAAKGEEKELPLIGQFKILK